MSSRAPAGSAFFALRVLLTEDCNISCAFCHNEAQSGISSYSSLNNEGLRTLIKVGRQRSLRQVKFSGGEPTLHPMLPSLVEISVSSGMDTVVISNGTNIEPLKQVATLGARISINIPSASPETYRGLTGADINRVLQTLAVLGEARAEIAVNSYAKLIPDPSNIISLLRLIEPYPCSLKLLLPCQIVSVENQRAARAAYAAALVKLNFKHQMETPYDSRWNTPNGTSIRVVQPWCPTACKQVVDHYKSLRLAANTSLLPCFGGSSVAIPLDLSSDQSCATALDKALSITANECRNVPGIRIIHRQHLIRARQTKDEY